MFDLEQIKYHNIQESFGMGGPYLGELEFNGNDISGKFLADSEILNEDKSKIVFSRLLTQYSGGFQGLKSKRDFRIFIYDTNENKFFQSKESFECLAIEKMERNQITFHRSFHTKIYKYRDSIDFNMTNFDEIEITTHNNMHKS
ncbi:MAG: hypothetical protein ABFS12_17055 [Bacteroidota bacterium]